ncbi:MAG TPA: ABC transporter ATP-binding protein [Rhodospirillales bacterium]|nr:ABC transporter ATP-binding protein [Rhodospirillales bacterium]HIC60328.1 ABC transporter ATP-binding protein [Rhodospirillales bacterium]
MQLKELSSGYGDVPIIKGLSLEVNSGSITALVGSNGAGKTTLMKTISGLLPVMDGEIFLDGEAISGTMPYRRVGLGLSLVPEGRLVFPEFSVEENLKIGAITPRAQPDRTARTEEMFELFPRLKERRNQAGGTLSGGEQQMLAIARGLMSAPRMLLLDEPSLGLAPNIAKFLFEMVVRVKESGVTIFIVEQDIKSTLEIADHGYVIENGQIVTEGLGSDLLVDEAIKTAYLGI